MANTAIVIDADACVPDALARELALIVVPGDAALFAATDSIPALGLAAEPSPAEPLAHACAAAAERTRSVLYISAHDDYSSAPDAAPRARTAVAERAPGAVFVEHAANAALMGYGWQAVAAARALIAGADAEGARTAAARVGTRAQVLVLLEHPELSGVGGLKVPGTARLRALVAVRGARLDVLMRPKKREDGLVALRDRFAELASAGAGTLHVAVHHAGAAAGAEALATWTQRRLAPDELLVSPITRHAATRFGPRMIGVAWYREPD